MVSISLDAVISSPQGTFNLQGIRSVSKQLDELAGSAYYHLIVVVGASGASRPYIDVAKKFEKRKGVLDKLAIEVSKANAMVLIASLQARNARVFPRPLANLKELGDDWLDDNSGMIVVFCGFSPGHSSNSTAALIAKKFRCPLVIATTNSTKHSTHQHDIHRIDRAYLRACLSEPSKGANVLDAQTCNVLLEMPRGWSGAISGYQKISEAIRHKGSNNVKIRRIQL